MFCVRLEEGTDPSQVGGKAYGLLRVQRLGLRVPATMVIVREALRLMISHNGLEQELETYRNKLHESSTRALARRHRGIARRLHAAEVPEQLRHELTAAVRQMLADAPAGLTVRSSAVYEDSEEASFAGVFESYVGVTDAEEAIRAVLDCWISSWSPRAMKYVRLMGVDPIMDSMAVIVQPVVPARASGVICTANPSSGSPWEFVVHATSGLAMDLMSGSGAGDRYVLKWEDGAMIGQEPVGVSPLLNASDLTVLAGAARQLDDATSKRMDIEWALTDELWILQARPLTTVPSFFPTSGVGIPPEETWQIAPFVLALRQDLPPGFLTPLYSDMSESEMWYRYQPDDVVLTGIWRKHVDVNGYRYVDSGPRPTFFDYFKDLNDIEPWLEKNEPRYRHRWERRNVELAELAETAKTAIDGTESAGGLVPVMLWARDKLWDLNSFGWSGPQSLGWMCEALIGRSVRAVEPGFRLENLLGGEDSYTLSLTSALQDLARSITDRTVRDVIITMRLDQVIGFLRATEADCLFLRDYEALCRRFGKTPPSWRDRPPFWRTYFDDGDAGAISTIRATLLGESRDAREAQRQARIDRGQQEERIRRTIAAARPDFVPRFDRILEWARYWTQALNDRHGVAAGLLWERELIWQVGLRFVHEGLISSPVDLLVFRREDLETYARRPNVATFKTTYEARLLEYQRNLRLRAPQVLGPNGGGERAGAHTPREEISGTPTVIKGVGFGRGSATGRARVIRAMSAEVLESIARDDILVVIDENAFAYADWHSLLMRVNGVVSAARPAHHLTQVAREIGVPVVGYVRSGLGHIREGCRINVDAESGLVRLDM
jgi:phosphohistidine swiveling domain-containing protein